MSCKSDNDMDYNPLGESEDGNDHNISLTRQTSSKRVRSQYWDYFDAVLNSNRLATCRFCHVQISFRTTVSNLGKHLKKKHLAELASKVIPDPQPDRTLDSDYTKIGCEKKSHVMLYFDESVHEGKSLCKACDKEIASNESTSLMKHVLSHSKHDFVGKLDESLLEEDFLIGADPLEPRPGKKRSVAWRYFTVVDRERKLARCKLCKKVLAYAAGVSNLVKHVSRQHVGMELQDTDEDGESQPITQVSPVWAYFKCLDEAMSIASCLLCKKRVIFSEECRELYRHLHKKHPSIDLDKNTFGKTFMLTDDGKLYEVETNKSGTAEAVDKTDNENESHTTEVYLDDDTFYEPEPKIKTPTKRKPSYVAHTPLLKLPKKEPVTETEDSIELFGKYIVSLLKKLPKISSNRLQYEFVKQIFEAQHEKTVSEGTMTDDDNSGTNNRLTSSQNT